jgi:hypothetical protein
MAVDGRAVDVVALACFKCRSASRTNQTTSDVMTKLAAAAKKKIGDRFNMSLPPGDRDIGGHRSREAAEIRELKYFANNADSCNPLRTDPNFDGGSSRLSHQRQGIHLTVAKR